MGVSIQDRTDFLNMLDACRTEQQLFSRLTFAVMFHQTDPDAREDLLDDVRGAACNMQLPAVNYKIDQWLNTCKQAWQADPAAFMAAVNADAKQRKLALEGSAAQPGLLADVPMQSVAWLVPQLLPLGKACRPIFCRLAPKEWPAMDSPRRNLGKKGDYRGLLGRL